MFAPGLIQGRWLGIEDFDVLQRLIAEHPHWSRRRLSIALCEALNWRTASGQLKDMSARLLLNKLAERGLIKLPARRRGGGRQILRALSEPELFSLSAGAGDLIEGPLRALQPLEVIRVEPRTLQANAFVWHLAQHHYLGFEGAAGQNLRYLLRDCYGRDLACVLFAAAAWKVQARDGFIGWSAPQRQQRLSLIINNSRFLILPQVRVPHLASHILGTILRRVRGDWQPSHPAWQRLLSSKSALLVAATGPPTGCGWGRLVAAAGTTAITGCRYRLKTSTSTRSATILKSGSADEGRCRAAQTMVQRESGSLTPSRAVAS